MKPSLTKETIIETLSVPAVSIVMSQDDADTLLTFAYETSSGGSNVEKIASALLQKLHPRGGY